jgi:oxygen-independent coproporphyrinogen III oxidase
MTASLYIHIPFCVRKCEYCDFYSGVATEADIDRYLDALEHELRLRFPRGFAPATVFMGGGTPTRLSAGQLLRLGDILRARLDLSACTEFTSEINPGTLTPAKADALRRMGVNRASFGVQSFNTHFLKALGRAYEAGTATGAVEMARAAGIERVSMDLMFALPGQTLSDLRDDLQQALSHGTEHLSLYALTYEDDTPLTRQLISGEVRPCDEELERKMFVLVGETCAAHGLQRYEVSNFATPGAECRHNLVYWTLGDWHGAGAGAHGMIGGAITRNAADYHAYTRALLQENRLPEVETDQLSPVARAESLLLMGMRLTAGVELARFKQFAGIDFTGMCGESAARLIRQGLIELTPTHVRPTEDGLMVLDSVILELASGMELPA